MLLKARLKRRYRKQIYLERTMKPTRTTAFLTFTILFFMGMTPLFADSVTIGANGDLSLNRPFCGT